MVVIFRFRYVNHLRKPRPYFIIFCVSAFINIFVHIFSYHRFISSKRHAMLDQLNSKSDMLSLLVMEFGQHLSKQVAKAVDDVHLGQLGSSNGTYSKPLFIAAEGSSKYFAAGQVTKLKVAKKLRLLMNLMKSEKKQRFVQVVTGKALQMNCNFLVILFCFFFN